MEKLALLGGPPAKTIPYGTGKRFGQEELVQLGEALEQNTLFYWSGQKTKALCEKFAGMYGAKHCVAASSGTAAIHVALGALDIGPGDEVITSPITDMGTLIGILYQNAIPVFADLEPYTYNLDPQSIKAKITDKTKAILAVHLAGNPADMDAIMAIANEHNIQVIEDCAQSYLCYDKGRPAGTIGHIGCFSLNDFKHISAGDGGMLLMNDEDLYYKAFRFADKNYNRFGGNLRQIESLAPNYRMNELTAAVGLAQLDRLEDICRKRNTYGDKLSCGIRDLPGIHVPEIKAGNQCSYWFYMLRYDENVTGRTRDQFCEALNAEGVPATPGYIPCCVYEYDLFTQQSAYPGSRYPFVDDTKNVNVTYGKGLCPVAEEILRTAIRLNVNEFFTQQDLDETIAAIRKVSRFL